MRAIFTNPTKGHLLLNDKFGNLIVKLPPNQTFDITPYIGEISSLNDILERVVINNHIESLIKNKIRGKVYNNLAHSDYFILQANMLYSSLNLLFYDLRSIDGDPTSLDYWNTFFNTSITADKPFNKVEIEDSLVKLYGPTSLNINGDVFINNLNLSSIINDTMVKSIGNTTFVNCTSLINISLSVATEIRDFAFYNCTSLSGVYLPAAVTIGSEVFASCTSLSGISLPLAVTIGDSAFNGCTSLAEISLPIATTIGNNVFQNITGNTITLTIPHAILASNNSSLNELTGNNTVTIIEV